MTHDELCPAAGLPEPREDACLCWIIDLVVEREGRRCRLCGNLVEKGRPHINCADGVGGGSGNVSGMTEWVKGDRYPIQSLHRPHCPVRDDIHAWCACSDTAPIGLTI